MSVEESVLICPHCGTRYNEGDSVCPSCGKPLSLTGYSQYGGDELPAPNAPAGDELFLRQAFPTSTEDTLDGPLIEAAPTPLASPAASPVPPSAASEPDSAAIRALVRTPFSRETTPQDSEWQPDVQANRVVRGCAVYIVAAIILAGLFFISQFRIYFTYSSARPAATPTSLVAPASPMKSAYTMYLAVVNYAGSLTILNINMYNLGTTPAIFPPEDTLIGATAQVSITAVEFLTSSTATASYKPNDLDYQAATVLLPVVNGKVHSDRFIIIRDPVAAQRDFPRGSYVVVGQVDFGFEDIDKLRSGGKVNAASIIPDKGKATPTVR
jgi:hypothetical protein